MSANPRGVLAKLLAIGAVAAIAATATTAAGASSAAGSITIGVVESLTGPTSVYGKFNVYGIQLAVSNINASGGILGRKVQISVQDDRSDKTQAQSVMQSFVGNSSVIGVIGPTSSASAFAGDPVANAAGLPVIAAFNNADGIPQIGPYVHRITVPVSAMLPAEVSAAVKLKKIKSVALMYASEDPFATSGYHAMLQAFQQANVKVTASVAYDATTTVNFGPQLGQATAGHPDALAIAGYGAEAGIILKQAREIGGFNGPIIGNGVFASPSVYQAAGSDANGLIVASQWAAAPATGTNGKFVRQFKNRFKTDADDTAALAYDAVYLIKAALEREKKVSRAALQAGLEALPGFHFLGSPVQFVDTSATAKGTVSLAPGERDATTANPVLLEIVNGKLKTISKAVTPPTIVFSSLKWVKSTVYARFRICQAIPGEITITEKDSGRGIRFAAKHTFTANLRTACGTVSAIWKQSTKSGKRLTVTVAAADTSGASSRSVRRVVSRAK